MVIDKSTTKDSCNNDEIVDGLNSMIMQCHEIMVKENPDYNIESCAFCFSSSNLDGRVGFLSGIIYAIGCIKGFDYIGDAMKIGNELNEKH